MREREELPERIGALFRYGRIASVDLGAGRMTVSIGDIETQPVRWFTGGSGSVRVWTRPKQGEQVMLICPDGDIAGAIALRGIDCTAFPPVGDPNRDLVEFADGATLSYDDDAHALAIDLPTGATVSIKASGGVTIDSDVHITGKVTVDDDVLAGTVSLKHHRHLQVASGQAVSGEPKP